jgi:hypothetical protein
VQKGTFVAGIAFRASKGPGRPRMGPGGTARPTRPPTNNLTTTGVVNETGTNGPLHPKVAPFDKTPKNSKLCCAEINTSSANSLQLLFQRFENFLEFFFQST